MTNAANGVKFDMLDTGNPIQMAWTGKNSNVGFLVIDLNGNGKIDNGGELFSNVSPQSGDVLQRNGFRALAMYDQPKEGGNRDGIIDSRDAVFSKLRIWVDTNQNGKSEPNELMTMAQAGIKSIGLKYAPDNWKDVNGNEFRFTAKATFTNGRTEAIYDVYLKTPDTTPQAKK